MSVNSPYSPLKIIHHGGHLSRVASGSPTPPIHVQLILTNRCIMRCSHCAYRLPGYTSNQRFADQDEISYDKAIEIVDDCRDMGVKAIQLTGGGEPLCHPQFRSIAGRIIEHGIDLGLVTNGALMTRDVASMLRYAKWVRVSMDAGCSGTFAATRGVNERVYGKVRSAVRMLVEERQGPEPIVGVGFVVTRDNYKEVEAATLAARDDGADNIRISAVFQSEGVDYFRDFHAAAASLCRAAEVFARGGIWPFEVQNNFADRIQDLTEQSPDYDHCGQQFAATYIGADLNIYRCCGLAYNDLGRIGSLATNTFRGEWFSPELQAKLTTFDPRGCPRCMFNTKNRIAQYAITKNPMHGNFV